MIACHKVDDAMREYLGRLAFACDVCHLDRVTEEDFVILSPLEDHEAEKCRSRFSLQ